MINHTSILLALRARAVTLSVATTGLVTLSATATGYARTVGDFYADGFWPGMELASAGFATNGVHVITDVQPQLITVADPVPVEAAAAGRTLSVGLPSGRAWEEGSSTGPFVPTIGVPYVEDQYMRGPNAQRTLGPNGELELLPQYQLQVHVPQAWGLTASRYVDALYGLFAPRTAIALASGDIVRVRSDVGPTGGQLQQSAPGFSVIPLMIPLRLRTPNLI